MNTEIFYNIRTELEDGRSQEIEFSQEYNQDGECIDGSSFNPTSGWTNYTGFTQGWSEQDKDLNEALQAIKEYSQSMDLEILVADTTHKDIGNTYTTEYYCEQYVDTKQLWTFIVTIEDICLTGDIIDSLNTEQLNLLKEAIETQYNTKVDMDDFKEYLELTIEDAEAIQEFNSNTWGFLKQGILEDYSKHL